MTTSKKRFTRFCELHTVKPGGCKKKFETNYPQQHFCEPSHQQEFHRIRRRDQASLSKRLAIAESEIRKLDNRVEALERWRNINLGS